MAPEATSLWLLKPGTTRPWLSELKLQPLAWPVQPLGHGTQEFGTASTEELLTSPGFLSEQSRRTTQSSYWLCQGHFPAPENKKKL